MRLLTQLTWGLSMVGTLDNLPSGHWCRNCPSNCLDSPSSPGRDYLSAIITRWCDLVRHRQRDVLLPGKASLVPGISATYLSIVSPAVTGTFLEVS